jgi:hypothetical protein
MVEGKSPCERLWDSPPEGGRRRILRVGDGENCPSTVEKAEKWRRMTFFLFFFEKKLFF